MIILPGIINTVYTLRPLPIPDGAKIVCELTDKDGKWVFMVLVEKPTKEAEAEPGV